MNISEIEAEYEHFEGRNRHFTKKNPNSNKSKASSKSKHKHIYEECLLMTPEEKYYKATRCKICSKIGDVSFGNVIRKDDELVYINSKELNKYYPDLPIYFVEDIWDKYA